MLYYALGESSIHDYKRSIRKNFTQDYTELLLRLDGFNGTSKTAKDTVNEFESDYATNNMLSLNFGY